MNARYPSRKILVPMDFSDDSRRACEYAVAMARATGAELALLTVIEVGFPYPELFALDNPGEDFYKTLRQRALDQMGEVLAGVDDLSVERLVVRGKPRVEILAMAEEIGADLMVMARHGSSGLRDAFMGSTTIAVLRAARCAVVVLPALQS